MPELAELKLTSDFINRSSEGIKYVNHVKNPNHKGEDLKIPFKFFRLSCESRGKELMITV